MADINIQNIGNIVTPAGASAIFGAEATEDRLDILTAREDTYTPYSIVYVEEVGEEDKLPASQVSYSPPGDSHFEAENVQEALDQFEDLVNNNVPQYIKETKLATEGQSVFALSKNFQTKGMLVFLNGLLLEPSTHYTYANKVVTLVDFSAEEDDILQVVGLASSGGSMISEKIEIDLSDPEIGDTFNYGKYQVESEDPWEIEWEVVDVQSDYVIAQTKAIIDLRCFDAKEPNNTNSDRQTYGNNNWQYSNIKQFLNSDQESWYSAQHTYDAAPTSYNVWSNYNPYDTHKGFLYYFSDNEKQYLQDMTLTLANNTVTDGGGSYTWTGKVWLPTYTQMGFGNNANIAEGTQFSKYTNNSSRIKYIHEKCAANNVYSKAQNYSSTTTGYYYCSSADPSYSDGVWLVDTDDAILSSLAYNGGNGLAPCIKLPKKKLQLGGNGMSSGSTTSASSSEYVIERNKGSKQYFWRGTKSEYDAINSKDDNTLYIVTDEGGSGSSGNSTSMPSAYLATLTVAGWDSSALTQTVTVPGILADESKQMIIPMPTIACMTDYNDAGIQLTNQGENALTFTTQEVPTADIQVYVSFQAVNLISE